MQTLIKPSALKPGDMVATVSLSRGTAGALPGRYEAGRRQFESTFGVKIMPMKNSMRNANELYEHPEWRLADLMDAFQNPDIRAILTNIGGDDTIRLLRHMTDEHFEIIHKNPKVFMGMSDTTINHLMCLHAGLGSFYTPSLMFGYAENCGIPEYMADATRRALFSTEPIGVLPESTEFIVDMIDWATGNDIRRPRHPTTPWRYIQGNAIARGHLIGGCAELISQFAPGTKIYPAPTDWDGAILFLETSENKVPPSYIEWMLRNFGAAGILDRINGILFARPGGEFRAGEESARDAYIASYPKYDDAILKVLREYGRTDLPVVTNMPFGHTIPQLVLPYGRTCEINPIAKTVSITESGVV